MNLSQLADAGRCPTLPCRIELADDDALTIEAWLRTLPGQRYVGRARWNDREVLAKLMVGEKARRHFERERDGARLGPDHARSRQGCVRRRP